MQDVVCHEFQRAAQPKSGSFTNMPRRQESSLSEMGMITVSYKLPLTREQSKIPVDKLLVNETPYW